MKKILCVLTLAVLVFASQSNAQLMFSVKPGLTGNSAQFGLKLGPIMAFTGVEYMRGAVTVDANGTYASWNGSNYELKQYQDKTEGSVSIFAPMLGAKLLFGGGDAGKTGAYVTAIVSKPIISGKLAFNGKEDEDFKKIFDNLSAWMLSAGFGGEYFFSESFSIGGEFGLRILLVSYKDKYEHMDSGLKVVDNIKASVGIGATYSTLVLNYYF